jgi:hypothetical protein
MKCVYILKRLLPPSTCVDRARASRARPAVPPYLLNGTAAPPRVPVSVPNASVNQDKRTPEPRICRGRTRAGRRGWRRDGGSRPSRRGGERRHHGCLRRAVRPHRGWDTDVDDTGAIRGRRRTAWAQTKRPPRHGAAAASSFPSPAPVREAYPGSSGRSSASRSSGSGFPSSFPSCRSSATIAWARRPASARPAAVSSVGGRRRSLVKK